MAQPSLGGSASLGVCKLLLDLTAIFFVGGVDLKLKSQLQLGAGKGVYWYWMLRR